ncbi:MAG: restriction endonuclease subunit S [Nitrospirales bacterium]
MSKLDANTILPVSWSFVPLKKLGDWSGGGTPSKAKPQYWQGGTIPWISPKDMKTERISDSEDHITKEAVSHSATSLINAGSVLIVTRSGILRHTLPVAVNSVPVTINQDLKALTPRNGIVAEYVAWALRAFSRDILHTCSKQGTTVNSVETSKLLGFEIPVAPSGQQTKIVAEIEKKFFRLDEAVANLKRVKANFKRYKAAVLKAAVEGKLTEDWRKQHPNIESASKLLERILTERRAKWKGKGAYKEPAGPDTTDLSTLPQGWVWTSLGQIFKICIGATPSRGKPEYWNGNIAWVSSGEVAFCRIRQTREHITEEGLDNTSTEIHPPGTVLMGMIGEGKTRGQAAILDIAACNNQNSAAIRVSEAGVPSEYVYRYLEGQYAENRSIGSGNNQPALNKSRVQTIPLPLSPLAEQREIVAEVERHLSVIDELEATVQANLTRADRLRQSILSRAFSGRLLGEDTKHAPDISTTFSIAAESQARYGRANRARR